MAGPDSRASFAHPAGSPATGAWKKRAGSSPPRWAVILTAMPRRCEQAPLSGAARSLWRGDTHPPPEWGIPAACSQIGPARTGPTRRGGPEAPPDTGMRLARFSIVRARRIGRSGTWVGGMLCLLSLGWAFSMGGADEYRERTIVTSHDRSHIEVTAFCVHSRRGIGPNGRPMPGIFVPSSVWSLAFAAFERIQVA